MFGNGVMRCDRNLKNWKRTQDLHKIKVPVLVLQGEYDYVTPYCGALIHRHLPQSEFAVLRGCSHTPFYEVPEVYQTKVCRFLKR